MTALVRRALLQVEDSMMLVTASNMESWGLEAHTLNYWLLHWIVLEDGIVLQVCRTMRQHAQMPAPLDGAY